MIVAAFDANKTFHRIINDNESLTRDEKIMIFDSKVNDLSQEALVQTGFAIIFSLIFGIFVVFFYPFLIAMKLIVNVRKALRKRK